MRLAVKRIIEEWDMRSRTSLRELLVTRRLKKGECVVAFNRKMTIARILINTQSEDAEVGTLEYYASEGYEFDMDVLRNIVSDGTDITIAESRTRRQRAA